MLGRYTDKTFNHFQLCSQQGWTLRQTDCEHCIPAFLFFFNLQIADGKFVTPNCH